MPLYSMMRVPFGIRFNAKTPRPWMGELRTEIRRRLVPFCMTTPYYPRRLSAFAIHPANELAHSLGRRLILILPVEAQAHAVDFAALQALVQLAAFAERSHHHIGRDRHQAQMFLGIRRSAAEVTIHQGANSAVEVRCAAAQHQRAGQQPFHGSFSPIGRLDAMNAVSSAQE